MRVVFAGTPEVAVPALEAVAASRHELVGVVTRPDAPAGRGRRLVASPVGLRAEELGVPVLKPRHPRDPDFQAALRELGPDCCPVVAYGALLPQSALDIPAHGWVNLHFSVLPAWRGAAPVQHAIWAGDEVSGATTFRIVKELDAGPTYGLMTQTIRPGDTAGDLLQRLAEGGAGLLVQTLDGIEDGALEAREQPGGRGQLRPEDHRRGRPGRLDRAGRRGRPPHPCVHARPGCLDDARTGSGSSWVRCVRSARRGRRRPRAGSGARRQEGRPGRHRHDPVQLGRVQAHGARRWTQPTGPVASGSSPVPDSAGSVAPMAARASTPGPAPKTSTTSVAGCRRRRSAPRGATSRRGWCRRGDKGRGFVLYRKPHKSAVDPATGEEYDDLLVIRTANPDDKLALVEGSGPFFTIDHFNGLQRRAGAAVAPRRALPRGAGRGDHRRVARVAPKKLVREFLG